MSNQETADTFIKKGEEFQKQLDIGRTNAQKSIKENCLFLRDYYYNKNNHSNLSTSLQIIDLVDGLKKYDNQGINDE